MGIEAIYPKLFSATIKATRTEERPLSYSKGLLCLDPGETTGWAYFNNHQLVESGQWSTKDRAVAALSLIHSLEEYLEEQDTILDVRLVMEDYRMYSWKKDEHTFSKLHTPKLIGAFEAASYFSGVPYTMQMAGTAKSFATDDLLEHWGMWQKGQRHARDAIRHGLYYMMFNQDEFNTEAPNYDPKS